MGASRSPGVCKNWEKDTKPCLRQGESTWQRAWSCFLPGGDLLAFALGRDEQKFQLGQHLQGRGWRNHSEENISSGECPGDPGMAKLGISWETANPHPGISDRFVPPFLLVAVESQGKHPQPRGSAGSWEFFWEYSLNTPSYQTCTELLHFQVCLVTLPAGNISYSLPRTLYFT